jgi:hypothetical protein
MIPKNKISRELKLLACDSMWKVCVLFHHGFDQQRQAIKYKGHTLAYNAKATADSRKRVKEFFVTSSRCESVRGVCPLRDDPFPVQLGSMFEHLLAVADQVFGEQHCRFH